MLATPAVDEGKEKEKNVADDVKDESTSTSAEATAVVSPTRVERSESGASGMSLLDVVEAYLTPHRCTSGEHIRGRRYAGDVEGRCRGRGTGRNYSVRFQSLDGHG